MKLEEQIGRKREERWKKKLGLGKIDANGKPETRSGVNEKITPFPIHSILLN